MKRSARNRTRAAGFTMLECVVAILVINLTIAGFLKLLSGQDAQLKIARDHLAREDTFRMRPHADPLARALGMPATLDAPVQAVQPPQRATRYQVRVVDWWRSVEPERFRVVFERTETPEKEKQPEQAKESGGSKPDMKAKSDSGKKSNASKSGGSSPKRGGRG